MLLTQFDYHLPPELISQRPVRPRDHSRLMVVNRQTQTISHHHFYDLPKLLNYNYTLVFNNTKVIPARLYGRKSTGGKVEVLLTKQLSTNHWQALAKPGLKSGQTLLFNDKTISNCIKKADVAHTYTSAKSILTPIHLCLSAKVIRGSNNESLVELEFNQTRDTFRATLQNLGETPLPPYIKGSKLKAQSLKIKKWYQTVYACNEGSVAAPTAGFHFTKKLINSLKNKNIEQEYVTLHVGLGTFLPVKENDISRHKIHAEYFSVGKNTNQRLREFKLAGKKILAVGTTSCRVLETLATNNDSLKTNDQRLTTNLYIYPPYRFKFVDALITNFHLPHSTLLMLVSTFVSYPNTPEKFQSFKSSFMGHAYQEAIKQKYRFYSFGDAMLIL